MPDPKPTQYRDVKPLEGFHFETGILLATLKNSTREWRQNLGTPKPAAIVWQPVENGHSIGSVILHIIDVEAYWFETFAAKKRPDPKELKLLMSKEIKQYGGKWPIPPAEPIEWYYELHDRIRERTFQAIREIEPEHALSWQEYEMTMRWLVAHVVHHDSYHGGQAVLLHELWKKMGRKIST